MDTMIISYPTQSTHDALPSSLTNALDYFVDMQYPKDIIQIHIQPYSHVHYPHPWNANPLDHFGVL
jgi:hypothetical protein